MVHAKHRGKGTQYAVVTLSADDYASLQTAYARCLAARSGTKADWQQYVHRADELEQALIAKLNNSGNTEVVQVTTEPDTTLIEQLATMRAALEQLKAEVAALRSEIELMDTSVSQLPND